MATDSPAKKSLMERVAEPFENVRSWFTDRFGHRDEALEWAVHYADIERKQALEHQVSPVNGHVDTIHGQSVRGGNVIQDRSDVLEIVALHRQQRLTHRGYVTTSLTATVESLTSGEIREMVREDLFDTKVLAPSLDAYQQQRHAQVVADVKADLSLLERPEWTAQLSHRSVAALDLEDENGLHP